MSRNSRSIAGIGDLYRHLKKGLIEFYDGVKDRGGFNAFALSLLAQILWLGLLYRIYILWDPMKSFFLDHASLLIGLGILNLVWKVLKDNMPSFVGDLASGRIFHIFSVKFLYVSILGLLFFHLLVVYIPISNWLSKFKPKKSNV